MNICVFSNVYLKLWEIIRNYWSTIAMIFKCVIFYCYWPRLVALDLRQPNNWTNLVENIPKDAIYNFQLRTYILVRNCKFKNGIIGPIVTSNISIWCLDSTLTIWIIIRIKWTNFLLRVIWLLCNGFQAIKDYVLNNKLIRNPYFELRAYFVYYFCWAITF